MLCIKTALLSFWLLASTAKAYDEYEVTPSSARRKMKTKTSTEPHKPRVRREWRTLSPEMRQKVADAFWTVKETSAADGQELYGDKFLNYDELLLLHACAVRDPRCDQGHYGPQFITFHRAVVLQMENALLAVDPDIGAIPYWDYSKDTVTGEYYQDADNYIFSDNYFGDYIGNPDENYAVTNGLFAYWPISEYTTAKYGSDSDLSTQCAAEEWYRGFNATVCDRCCGLPEDECTCDPDTDTYRWNHRAHDDCTPYVARNAYEGSPIDGTYELQGTSEEFEACNNPDYINSWIDWQNCIEFEQVACLLYLKTNATCDEVLSEAIGDLPIPPGLVNLFKENLSKLAGICDECTMTGFYHDQVTGEKSFVQALHSQAHIRLGRDLLDVTTSPNDAALFMGYHANLDRNNMIWMMNTKDELEDDLWHYPSSQSIEAVFDIVNNDRLSGPFSNYDALICSLEPDHFTDYNPYETPWLKGTLSTDILNSGYPFTNLFDEEPDDSDGYTHEEIIYYTAPDRTPYTYDTLESYYYEEP